ncbi:apses-domain-containing protein [Choiromyces venosus 120613-1]|uniref:Apses-domain-containing protein n=1 Tax=Choiromyces venosus 120613-1 TaxID=1336337 RepID=A0A3N4JDF6_9PEZI|nr:apses-domain-containing protein [Choiromyces venosus 120613-1]
MARMDSADSKPTIFTATYSGVSVFEMPVNNVAVMRRRHDSWLNATQILKVAGVEKGKRTKVLEKEILMGPHEKVQGGYGKYQGTWIDFERGREFCRSYGVEDLLAPLLDLDVQAASGPDSTPTKEQAMAARRKRMYNSSLNQANGNSGPLFPPISATVTNAFNALSKSSARMDSPGPRGGYSQPVPSSSQTTIRPQESFSQESWTIGLPSETSFSQSQTQPDSAYASQSFTTVDSQIESHEPPRKRVRASTPLHDAPPPFYPTHMDTPSKPVQPLVVEQVPDSERARQILMNLFINPETDNTVLSHLDSLTPDQIDIPLDSTGSAAIHWSASLARVPLIRALITKGASISRVNHAGETALVRGCFVTNNFDQSSFPQLLNLLHPTIPIADNNGRTILHHIAVKSGMKGRSADSRYYLHCLLEFVAKHGASSTSQRTGGPKVMSLARFIGEIVNAQDKSGDTALNIAARIGNKSIIQQLLEVGADSSIPNRAGLRPIDFGVGGEPAPVPSRREQGWILPPAVVQKRQDIMKAIKGLIAGTEKDFQGEIEAKQEKVTSTLNRLREVTLKLGKEKEKMNQLRQRSRQHSELKQHCQNLRRAIEEENARLRERVGNTNGDIPSLKGERLDPDQPFKIKMELFAQSSDSRDIGERQKNYLKSLPSTAVLKAQIRAYTTNEENLREIAGKLHDKSTDLEDKFRRVVALCTGLEEYKIDSLLEGLVQAVESDPGEVDTARVSSFLRKVDESTGAD